MYTLTNAAAVSAMPKRKLVQTGRGPSRNEWPSPPTIRKWRMYNLSVSRERMPDTTEIVWTDKQGRWYGFIRTDDLSPSASKSTLGDEHDATSSKDDEDVSQTPHNSVQHEVWYCHLPRRAKVDDAFDVTKTMAADERDGPLGIGESLEFPDPADGPVTLIRYYDSLRPNARRAKTIEWHSKVIMPLHQVMGCKRRHRTAAYMVETRPTRVHRPATGNNRRAAL